MADEDQQLFVLTKRVKEALELINALDESKLAVIVKRLVRNIGEKVAPFTTEELEQLQEHLQLAEGQVRASSAVLAARIGGRTAKRIIICRLPLPHARSRAWPGCQHRASLVPRAANPQFRGC